MQLLRDLRNLGADTVFDLPKIVVIGSQSAGKSSLIEAVTGINVPRDSGTCTRCPMECTMSSATESWTCTISLRPEGPMEFIAGAERVQRFGPVITNKRDVDIWLRRAQGAILSTDPNKSRWEKMSADEIKRAIRDEDEMRPFTEDTIVVDIQDPDATDLSFVDLPGLIQNSDQNSIDLIKNLVRKHVAGQNTLILVTIPVSDDIQNQGAVVLAKEADPSGRRIIGVLTKPDMLLPGAIGAHQLWKQTLENQNTPNNQNYLQHGYYCVRLPDDASRQKGYTAQNLPNPDYFDVTRPWSEVEDRRRFGVTNLVSDVSALLVQLIEANLPMIRNAVEAALKACLDRLAQLPPLTQGGEPFTNIMLLINGFLRELDAAAQGDSHKSLAQSCRQRYNSLRDEIFASCPQFRPKTQYKRVPSSDYDDDDEDDGQVNVYDIAAVNRVIQECTSWELPGCIPYDVYKTLIKRFLHSWNASLQDCFEEIFRIFSAFLEGLSDNHLAAYRNLKVFVLSHARTQLEQAKKETQASVEKLVSLEGQPFVTQRSDFVAKQEEWMRSYHNVFWPPPKLRNAEVAYTPSWHYRDEIHVMATVRTYFQFAYERFADTTLLMQEHDLVQSLRSKLEPTLISDLMNVRTRAGGLENLLSEDPDIERERREQTNRSVRLAEIKNRLDTFSVI
ncbi:hypothetical protein P691DRAFT_677583 [Macrolepiota fuliginosa MF-IS2]|uniref:P-loop containing nucleoside triphosphate hydrolase protein n=1 Tax=Macrolepiota fuliginosa MF-IS2 TaxID=1400762 RepID=A0A9P5X4N9_9AGAR|nr:hypothetical protein P691DRAFT_677583 [Macrolepiota fuliginosa MF-IS2]